jgi:dihydroorotate dehydrogenase electron transfer subunit
VLPVENVDGGVVMLRSCIDGPVMDGAHVKWDQVGRVAK